MATTILGTFPILNSKRSHTDEFGFDSVSYQYTVKTSDLSSYNIKKDDVFDGIENWKGVSFVNSSNPGSLYVVDSVEIKNAAGGLTELTVNTTGSKNNASLNSPRIVLSSSGPLIFGLFGTPSSGKIYGYGSSGAGQSVEVRFLADGGAKAQQALFATYFASKMPLSFRTLAMPTPATQPHSFSNVFINNEVGLPSGTSGEYFGFVCKRVSTEKRGSLLLVTLVYSEAGYATNYGITSPATPTQTDIYNFPTVG